MYIVQILIKSSDFISRFDLFTYLECVRNLQLQVHLRNYEYEIISPILKKKLCNTFIFTH